jgi:nucleotide-binding universal stress UspA family protein
MPTSPIGSVRQACSASPAAPTLGVSFVPHLLAHRGAVVAARILLAFDGSPPSHKAFDYVLRMPATDRENLLIVAVIRPSSFSIDFAAQTALEVAFSELSVALVQMQRRARFAGTNTNILLQIGEPAQQILKAATDHSVSQIILGHRIRWHRLPGWFSVSRRVRRRANCCVTTVE